MYMVLAQDVKNCGTVTDIEGNTYKTVVIGSQCWMAENLKTKHYANGTSINKGLKYSDGALAYINASYNTPYWYYPDGDVSNVLLSYGLLYNWAAVMGGASSSDRNPSGVQGICPNGWHVPSNSEWSQLLDFVSSNSQYVCESDDKRSIAKALASSQGWDNSSSSCTVGYKKGDNNKTGFGMLPAGYSAKAFTYNPNNFHSFGTTAEYWSSSLSQSENNAYIFGTYYDGNRTYSVGGSKKNGHSVRCVHNNPVDNATKMEGGQVEKQNVLVHSDNTQRNPTPDENTKQNNQKTNITSTPPAKSSCGTVEDYDGNTYKTVQIGKQCWMAENLRTTHYPDGKEIAKGTVSDKKSNLGYKYNASYNKGYWYYPNGGPTGPGVFWCTLDYGYLYNWKAAMGNANKNASNSNRVQGICPKGWHLPSWSEWEQLVNYVYNQPMYYCNMKPNVGKALASEYEWEKSDCNKMDESQIGNPKYPNNTTGFNAFPAGEYYQGSFPVMFYGSRACYWSSSEESENCALYLKLSYCSSYTSDLIPPHDVLKHEGLSVRCLRD